MARPRFSDRLPLSSAFHFPPPFLNLRCRRPTSTAGVRRGREVSPGLGLHVPNVILLSPYACIPPLFPFPFFSLIFSLSKPFSFLFFSLPSFPPFIPSSFPHLLIPISSPSLFSSLSCFSSVSVSLYRLTSSKEEQFVGGQIHRGQIKKGQHRKRERQGQGQGQIGERRETNNGGNTNMTIMPLPCVCGCVIGLPHPPSCRFKAHPV